MSQAFNVGETLKVVMNEREHTLKIIQFDGTYYAIRWDDGEEEWAHPRDLERWEEAWRNRKAVQGVGKQPFYEIDLVTKDKILGLIKQCEILNLGNVSFECYPTPSNEAKTFRMEQDNSGWELIVIERRSKTRDIYRIKGDQITHDYSEKD